MHSWLGAGSFLQTLLKVLVVWLAFRGAGFILHNPLKIGKRLPLLPFEITGMLLFTLLTIPLSVLHVMNRSVCPVLVLLFALPGMLSVYGSLREKVSSFRPSIVEWILIAVFLAVFIGNFTYASMVNLAFDDPLITYAVQPDRWLNAGKIFWLDETVFSGFPLLYEMTAVWPASLGTDRMNQLSVLQVFQMSMVLYSVLRGWKILGIRRKFLLPLLIVCLSTTFLYVWGAMAKTDSYALMMCTLALAAAVRQKASQNMHPYTSWLFMGAALASKQTALVVLLPFLMYSWSGFRKHSWKVRGVSVALMLALPLVFGVRTMIKTGSPTYPERPVGFMLHENWVLNHPEDNVIVNTRSSYLYESKFFPLLKHIGIFFWYMEGNILLLLAGILTAAVSARWKDLRIAIPILVYSAAAIKIFWPPWWGSKYSILVYPFVALSGAYILNKHKRGWITAAALVLPSVVIPGMFFVSGDPHPLSYRYAVASSVLSGEWDTESGYRIHMSTPEGMTHMWANTALSDDTVILSLNEEKRYFFDGTVIVAYRHPLAQQLFFENSLADETAILDALNVDYVGFYRRDPAPLDQEDDLVILDHIGTGMILEPVIIIDGMYLLCRYNSPSAI